LPATTRTERTEAAILKATRELLAEGGVAGLTIEGVAARSGVAKTTIYRRWRDKEELALAVLIDSTESVRTPPDVGDTRKELLTFITTATRIITENGVAAGLTSEIATRPELAARTTSESSRCGCARSARSSRAASSAETYGRTRTCGSFTRCSSGRGSTGCCSAAPR
jgi:AcrR family transcriptional regulator